MNELWLATKFHVWKGGLGACLPGAIEASKVGAGEQKTASRGRGRSQNCLRSSAAADQGEPQVLEAVTAGLAVGTEPGRVGAPANRKSRSGARRGGPAGQWGVPGVGVGVGSGGSPAGTSQAPAGGVASRPVLSVLLCKMGPF
ncbi:hypothetical protein P7K49_030575 [Saguinus oedipus]|uniref:Uncharacterized protein n=1 Tax=Saguinus oedipus TaxID=9490 RepID=A0ABQ9U2J2_SAGOE|nr:hypothetical protein P7K49_030575 [Saguinus oedipus]